MAQLATTAPDASGSPVLSDDFPRSDAQVAEIVAALDSDGFLCIAKAVRPEWLAAARDHVEHRLARDGKGYYGIVRPADEAGSPADAIVHDPVLQSLLRRAAAAVCPSGVAEHEDVYNVLRIVSGANGATSSRNFHYDASVITALVPLFIPDPAKGPSGQLVIFSNRRRFRGSVLVNLAEKLLMQNPLARKLATRIARGGGDRHARYLVPGNIYLFWGYRAYHANMPCAPHSLRATMLIFYGNPHGDNLLLNAMREGRRQYEKLRSGVR